MEQQQQPDKPDQPTTASMRQSYFDSIEVICIPVREIRTPPFIPALDQLIKEILTSHGAEVVEIAEVVKDGQLVRAGHVIITFPEGSYRSEVLPRTLDDKYYIVLPDKYRIFEICRRDSLLSFLRFDMFKSLTPDQQERLKAALDHC